MQETPEEGMIWSRGTVNVYDYSQVSQGTEIWAVLQVDTGQTIQDTDGHAEEFEIQKF